jgi:eukaryotic-like serine/threonine-protein kinase
METGLHLGKYDIQKEIGKGATGIVYLAKDTFTGRQIALKVLDPELFKDPEFGAVYRSQFMNEASLAGTLRHPHIVAILDAAVQEDSGYVAMELVTGGDLTQHIERDKLLPVADVLQIGFKCCGALDYAFRQGIFHRDIKPANIMIVKGTTVKIADFGAAHLRRTSTTTTQTLAVGSPYYMAPEQIQGKEPNYHSDLYSLGVVLYQLLTGERPFTANSLQMLMEKIVHQDPAPPSKLREGLPKEVDDCVLRAMKKEPRDRYDYYGEFALDLARAVKKVLPPESIPDSEPHVALRRSEMLAELADAEIWELARAARWSRVPKGTVIIREGDEGDSCFYLGEGTVKVHRKGVLLNLIKPSECFGEMAYIRGGDMPRHATVEATSDVLLGEFRPLELMQMSPNAQLALTRAFVRNLVDRLQLANTKLTQ